MKTILTIATFLALTATADAGYRSSYHGGYHRSAGFNVGVTRFPSHWMLDRSARVISAPRKFDGTATEFEHNTNPNWGKGCRSCADVSQ